MLTESMVHSGPPGVMCGVIPSVWGTVVIKASFSLLCSLIWSWTLFRGGLFGGLVVAR